MFLHALGFLWGIGLGNVRFGHIAHSGLHLCSLYLCFSFLPFLGGFHLAVHREKAFVPTVPGIKIEGVGICLKASVEP